MRSTGSRYVVRATDGTLHTCVAKGNLRVKGYTTTNPLAVGDQVEFSPAEEQEGKEAVGSVLSLHDRRNYIVRRSVNLSHHKHVIAANLDQALLVVTVARPRTSFGFIDRFLVTAEAYEVPAVVVLNKIDAYDDEELELVAEYEEVYQQAGYTVLITSALKGHGLPELKDRLRGKVSLVAGHSGAGKSTLINAIAPDLDLVTAEVSTHTEKGQHTTTYAEMYELGHDDPPTFIIDTPGVKGFGLVDMTQEEIVDQFPELFKLRGACRFGNCTHHQEPGCAVIKAVEDGEIAASRYNSYIDMVAGIDEDGPYRTA